MTTFLVTHTNRDGTGAAQTIIETSRGRLVSKFTEAFPEREMTAIGIKAREDELDFDPPQAA